MLLCRNVSTFLPPVTLNRVVHESGSVHVSFSRVLSWAGRPRPAALLLFRPHKLISIPRPPSRPVTASVPTDAAIVPHLKLDSLPPPPFFVLVQLSPAYSKPIDTHTQMLT